MKGHWMKITMLTFVGTILLSTSALAGTVSFLNPSSPYSGDPSVLEMTPGSTGTFDVWVTETVNNPGGSVDMVMATFSDLLFDDFVINEGLVFPCPFMGCVDWSISDQIPGATGISFGFADLFGAIGFPIFIGTLTLSAPNDMALGDYTIFVDHSLDGVSKVGKVGAEADPLFGMGIIRVTPEPLTLVLVGLCGIAILQRRRCRINFVN